MVGPLSPPQPCSHKLCSVSEKRSGGRGGEELPGDEGAPGVLSPAGFLLYFILMKIILLVIMLTSRVSSVTSICRKLANKGGAFE